MYAGITTARCLPSTIGLCFGFRRPCPCVAGVASPSWVRRAPGIARRSRADRRGTRSRRPDRPGRAASREADEECLAHREPVHREGDEHDEEHSGPSTKNGRGDRCTPTARATSQMPRILNGLHRGRQDERPGEQPAMRAVAVDPFVCGRSGRSSWTRAEYAHERAERSTGAAREEDEDADDRRRRGSPPRPRGKPRRRSGRSRARSRPRRVAASRSRRGRVRAAPTSDGDAAPDDAVRRVDSRRVAAERRRQDLGEGDRREARAEEPTVVLVDPAGGEQLLPPPRQR